MKTLNSKKGTSYLYIVVLVSVILLLMSVPLSISVIQSKISAGKERNMELRQLAHFGIDSTLALFNEYCKEFTLDLRTTNSSSMYHKILYKPGSSGASTNPLIPDSYLGSFYIKAADYVSYVDNRIKNLLDMRLDKNSNAYTYSYDLSHNGQTYSIRLSILAKNNTSPVVYTVSSTAMNKTNGSLGTVEGDLRLNLKLGNSPSSNPAVSEMPVARDVIVEPSYGWASGRSLDNFVPEIDQSLSEQSFAAEPSVLIANGSVSLDLESVLQSNPSCSIIINNSQGGDGAAVLSLTAPSPMVFKGIILSQGEVKLNNVRVEGLILSSTLSSESALADSYIKKDILFGQSFSSPAVQKMFFDYLGLTSFKTASVGSPAKTVLSNRLSENLKLKETCIFYADLIEFKLIRRR